MLTLQNHSHMRLDRGFNMHYDGFKTSIVSMPDYQKKNDSSTSASNHSPQNNNSHIQLVERTSPDA